MSGIGEPEEACDLFHFLSSENAKITKEQGKIILPLVKNQSAESFRFLQALILYFFHSTSSTDSNENLTGLVEIIVNGCIKIPGCRIDNLLDFVQVFANSLPDTEDTAIEYSQMQQLVSKLKEKMS